MAREESICRSSPMFILSLIGQMTGKQLKTLLLVLVFIRQMSIFGQQ